MMLHASKYTRHRCNNYCLQPTSAIFQRLFSSAFDYAKVGEIVVTNYHPKDSKLCLKTLKTLVSMSSKEAATSALSSAAFRSKTESRVFFTWLQSVISNAKDIPQLPHVRKLISRKKKTQNLLESCRMYLKIRESLKSATDRVIDFNKIESLILDTADNIPERLVFDVSAILRQYCIELEQSPEKHDMLSTELMKRLADSSSIYFDVLISLVAALDIVDGRGKLFVVFRTKAAKIQKQRVQDMANFSMNLLRLVDSIEMWDKKLNNSSNMHSRGEDDQEGQEHDDNDEEYSSAEGDDTERKIGRVRKISTHMWGWSLHCLLVSVKAKELSPLDMWLLKEEKRVLSEASAGDETVVAPGDFVFESAKSQCLPASASTPTNNTTSGSSLLLTPPSVAPLLTVSPQDAITSFVFNDDRQYNSDFDETYMFREIYTATLETRDQNTLEDIAADRDMLEKLHFTSSKNKILIESLPPMITEEDLRVAFARAGGGVQYMHIFHPERFEAAQPFHATLQNKKMKKKMQMKQIIHSDTFAFVAFESSETFDVLTTGDMRLFGLCMNGFRCKIAPAREYDTFYVETLTRNPTKYWIEILSSILGSEHEVVYGSAYSAVSPAFIQLKFADHESAWKAFMLLELALTDGVHYFQLNWRKCSWFYDLQTKSREKRRNNQKYLNAIADKVHADSAGAAAAAAATSTSRL